MKYDEGCVGVTNLFPMTSTSKSKSGANVKH